MARTKLRDLKKLEREAFDAAEQYRAGYWSREDAIETLQHRCPGFTRAEYERAFENGWLAGK
jgi:hypothetical protein